MHLIQTAFIYYAVFSTLEGAIGFNQRCPGSNEWHFRRKKCTSPDKPFYACLYNEFSLQYSENCTRKEYESRKGKKVVFSPAISETDCTDSRYQPIKFTTLSFSDCIYAKSTCSEEGQVLAKNESSFVDRSCRCDYRKGYDYITQPKDKCSCTPSLEDCSCYLTNCNGNSGLTQDYDCVLKIDSRSGSNVCKKILNGSPANATTNTNNTFIDKKEHSSSSSLTALTSILIFMSIIVVSILMLWVSLSIRVMPHIIESNAISNGIILYTEEGIPNIYHHIEGDNFTITCKIISRKLLPVKSVRWQKDGCYLNLKNYKHELNDQYTSLTIENLSENDTGTYTCIVSNWFGFNNTSVDKCICHLSALHSRMKWIQTIHRFQACEREDNRIAVNIHKLPELWKEEENKIGEEVKMDPLTYKNKELMKPSESVKSVVWFHLSKDIIRVVKQVQFVDINDRYLKQGQQSDKHIGTFKADQYDEAVKSKQKGDTKDGTVRADQQDEAKKETVQPDEHGDATEYIVDNNDDTKDRTYKPDEHGDLKNEGVKGDTQVKTVRLYQREDKKEGAVKAGKQGVAKDDAVKEVDYDDTKDGTGKQNDYVDGKDEGVIAKQQSDKKEKSVRLDQHGDAKKVPVKADEQGDTKDKTVRADQHDDKKDGTGKPDEHGDRKDGGIKHDVSDDEGTWDRIALTFKTTFSDNGQYVCILVGNGNVICIGWRLKVIPEGNVCRELMDHREDESYVKTSPVNDAMQCLENDGFVVITGREGTGKSKMKLQLVSLFQEKDFLPFEVNEKSLYKSLKDDLKTTKVIFLIDHIVYDPKGLDKMLEQLPDVSKNRQKKIVFACRNVDLPMVKSILQRNQLYNTKACIDLDNILTVDDKRNILENHMKVSNKSETHSNDTEINNTDDLKPVELEENDILEIIKTEPFTGFPLMASNFCSDRKHFNKGKKYFTNPPTYLLDEIRDLYQSSLEKKETELMKEYCVLVYLATDERLCLGESDCSTSRFHQLSMLIYKGKKEVNYYNMNSIKDAADQLVAKKKYIIKSDDHTYRFIHPYVSKAILLLSEKLLDYFIENGDVEDIMEFVRSYKYNVTEDELVLTVTEDRYAILCERLILVMTKQSEKEIKIGHYIYDCFIDLKDTIFLNALLSKVGCDPSLITMQTESSTEVDMKESKNNKDDRQTVMNAYQTPTSYNFDKKQNKSEEAPPIIFYSPPQMIAMIEHLTRTGKDPWIYEQNVPDFVVLYGLIVGCKNNFLGVAEEKKTFNIILKMFTNNLERKKFRLQCCSPMDTFDNTFCHFLTLFNESESCLILKRLIECLNYATKDTIIRGIQKKTERQNILKSKNIFEHSPLQMAAYLGKAKVFTDFSSESKKKKGKKEKLCEVVKNGMGGASVASRFADLNFDHELRKAICFGDTNAYKDIYAALKKW